MQRTFQIMNYFLLASVALMVYSTYQAGESLSEFYWPIATILIIMLGNRSGSRFWINAGYLGTLLFFFQFLFITLPLQYFSSIRFPVLIIVIGLTVLCAILRLSSRLLTIVWTTMFLLTYYLIFSNVPLKDFLYSMHSFEVFAGVIKNYLSILLLSVIVGLFIEYQNGNPRNRRLNY